METTNVPTAADLDHELRFTASRSSGPGGQNVNKVNSKVTLKFDVKRSVVLNDDQRELLMRKLETRLTKAGVLVLTADDKRSQLQNKEAVVLKLDALLRKAFTLQKTRRATKPSKAAKQKRLKTKKFVSEKKNWRRGIE